jgi:uncharacterized protein YwgA
MSNVPDLIVDIVALSGGRLVGRTRMQKTAYLLDAKGMKSGAAYYYYNFGPFSDEVADGISDSKFVGSLVEKIGHRQTDGSPFSIFESGRPANQITALGNLKRSDAINILNRLSAASSTVLELAATIHWLTFVEKVADWRTELKRRKGAKVDNGRMGKAADLLTQLGLSAA